MCRALDDSLLVKCKTRADVEVLHTSDGLFDRQILDIMLACFAKNRW
jgi:hypothetical protein